MELAGELNRLAGNPRSDYRGIAAAANQWAGTTDLELVGALNTKAGIPRHEWLDLRGVLRRLGFNEGGTADSPTGAAGAGQLQNTLRLPGLSGNYMSTPDTNATSITGDIDMRIKVAPDRWAGADFQTLIAKNSGDPNRSFRWVLNTGGIPQVEIWPTGTSGGGAVTAIGSAAVPFAAGEVGWVRITVDVDNGAGGNTTRFYTSTDGVTWAQLGSDRVNAGTTSFFDGAAPIEVGSNFTGSIWKLQGHVYYAEVRSGIDGNVVAKFDSGTVAVRGDSAPTTHTQPSAAEAIRLPGVAGNWLSQADSPANSPTGDLDVRARIAPDSWTGATYTILGKDSGAGPNRSWYLYIHSSNHLGLGVAVDGGTFSFNSRAHGLTGSGVKWVRATRVASSGVIEYFTGDDGITWTSVGTVTGPTGALPDVATNLGLGGRVVGASEPFSGLIYEAQVRNGIDGTVVANFNAANTVPTDMRTPATTSDGWTINGTAWSWDAPVTAPSSGALRLPGTAGNYVSTPDAADISITGDIDLRAKVTMDDWTPAANMALVAKYLTTGNQRSYQMRIDSGTGRISIVTSADGTTPLVMASSASPVVSDGGTKWVRATLDVNDGTVNRVAAFYSSDDGITWTAVGTPQTFAGTTSIFDSTAALEVGGVSSGGDPLAGYVHRAEVRNGIDGPIVAFFDAANVPTTGPRTPTTVVQSGRTWTVNGTAWSWVDIPDPTEWTVNGSDWWWGTYTGTQRYTQAIQLDEQYVYFPGTAGNYASTPDSAALSITGDIDIRAKIAPDQWLESGVTKNLVSKWNTNARSYRFMIGATGALFLAYSPDGTTQFSNGSTALPSSAGTVDGVPSWVRVTRASATGQIIFYTSPDGVTWTQLGTTIGGTAGALADTTAVVEIGSRDSGQDPFKGKVYYAEIRNGIGGTIVGSFTANNPPVTAIRSPATLAGFNNGETWTLNGSAWNWGTYPSWLITTPDSAALSIVGDIDVRMKATFGDVGQTGQAFLDKRGTNSGYGIRYVVNNRLEWIHGDGTQNFFKAASVALPYAPGQTGWIRVTVDVDNGAVGWDVKFYTSADGVTWTQLGTTQTTSLTTAIADNANPLSIGATLSGFQHMAGTTIHYAEIRNGIGGTAVGSFNPGILKNPYDQTPTTLKSATGETYTITGSGWRWVQSEV